MFCTNCHKIDITTGYCLQLSGNTSIQEKKIEFSMLHRHLIFGFVYWYNRSLLLHNMHIYICVATAVCVVCRTMLVCMALTTGQGC